MGVSLLHEGGLEFGCAVGFGMGGACCATEMGSLAISCTGGLKALGQCYLHWLQDRSLCARLSYQGSSPLLELDGVGLQCKLGRYQEQWLRWPLGHQVRVHAELEMPLAFVPGGGQEPGVARALVD